MAVYCILFIIYLLLLPRLLEILESRLMTNSCDCGVSVSQLCCVALFKIRKMRLFLTQRTTQAGRSPATTYYCSAPVTDASMLVGKLLHVVLNASADSSTLSEQGQPSLPSKSPWRQSSSENTCSGNSAYLSPPVSSHLLSSSILTATR